MVGGGGGTSFLLGLGLFGSASENFDVCYDKEAIDQAYKNREGLTWKERVELMWRTICTLSKHSIELNGTSLNNF